jgi:GTP-binding protein
VVVTKTDLVEEAPTIEEGQVAVSAVTGDGIDELADRFGELMSTTPAPERQSRVVLRPARETFSVSRVADGRFRVEGRTVERWVREADLEDPRQVVDLQGRLRKAGVEKRLAEEGARLGDEVMIAGRAFEYFPEP